ncbi:hypothetical protein PCC79_02685 [Propioniciclava soli]|uniref:Uncharacterized protein n=1 Tax=Propioniciclava soli TaxID=2775081 RepID=A0ABZ3C8M1_9ACTN
MGQTPDPLAAVVAARDAALAADRALAAAVLDARGAGCSWAELGDVLGVSRQAAFKRFGRPVDPDSGRTLGTGPHVDPAALAEAVFRSIAAADYAALHAAMTSHCARELSRGRVAGVWREVLAAVGEVESYSGHGVRTLAGELLPLEPQPGPLVARLVLEHEAGRMVGHVAVNHAGKVTGVLVAPLEHEDAMAF